MPQMFRIAPGDKLHPDERLNIGAMEIPSYRMMYADQEGVLDNIMIQVRGGIGDAICAEPAIRYAVNNFKSNKIYVTTQKPELYRHLKLEGIIDGSRAQKHNFDRYANFVTLPGDDLLGEFFAHMFSHVIDIHTMIMWRTQIHPLDKSINLECTNQEKIKASEFINPENDIVIHPGLTWKSRTLPKWWWDKVTKLIRKCGKRPVIIGGQSFNNCATVNIDTEGCFDLREKLTIMESVAVCKRTRVLFTNDSSPLHMAASGDAWIGYVSTVKPPHLLCHYRYGQMGWRMQNFSTDWLCNYFNMSPTTKELMYFDQAEIDSWLCKPEEIVEWGVSKL